MKKMTVNPERGKLLIGVKTFLPGDLLPPYVLERFDKLPADKKKKFYGRNLISLSDYQKDKEKVKPEPEQDKNQSPEQELKSDD